MRGNVGGVFNLQFAKLGRDEVKIKVKCRRIPQNGHIGKLSRRNLTDMHKNKQADLFAANSAHEAMQNALALSKFACFSMRFSKIFTVIYSK